MLRWASARAVGSSRVLEFLAYQNSSLQKAVEFFGAAGEFCCHSLHRSQISKDLSAMQANGI
jgi:hypothetical protein